MMLAARGAIRASGAGLPYDAEVEFLQSDGNAYINTGIAPAPNMDYSITFSAQNASTYYRIFGAWTASNQKRFGAIVNAQNILYQQMTPHGEVLSSYTSPNVVTIEKRGLACYVNGVYVNSFSSDIDAGEITDNLLAFAINTSGSAIAAVSGLRIYSFSLTLNGVLVRDYIPVRKKTVGYLYDRVSRKLFGNAGTGDFVVGPDVVPVEYLQSSGTQYIDTGFTGGSGTKIEITASSANTTSNAAIIGSRNAVSLNAYVIWQRASRVQMRFDYYGSQSSQIVAENAWDTIGQNIIVKDGPSNIVNGAAKESNGASTFTCDFPFYLFGNNSGGSFGAAFVGKMYACNIYDGGNPVRAMKPIRVGSGSTWEGAMMDTLTRRVYRNAGTGAFAYGNDLKYPIPA